MGAVLCPSTTDCAAVHAPSASVPLLRLRGAAYLPGCTARGRRAAESTLSGPLPQQTSKVVEAGRGATIGRAGNGSFGGGQQWVSGGGHGRCSWRV